MRIFLFYVILMFATLANSAVITQSQVFSGTPNFVNILTFDKFDGPGNLTDIIVKVDVTGNLGRHSVDNDSINSGIFQTNFGLTGDFNSPEVAFIDNNFSNVLDQVDLINSNVVFLEGNDGDGPNFDAGGLDYFEFPATTMNTSSSGNIADFLFFQYSGSGTYDVNVKFNQFLDFNGVGGLRGSFSPSDVSGVFTVEYHTNQPVADSPIFWAFFSGLLFIVVLNSSKRLNHGEE